MKSPSNVKRLLLKTYIAVGYTLLGEWRRVELKPFCSYTLILGQWSEGVHKHQWNGVEEGDSGVKECALSD